MSNDVNNGNGENDKMKKLISQILKFGVVGGLSFVIDFVITLIVSAILRKLGNDVKTAAAIGGIFGFCISLIFNYIMSIKLLLSKERMVKGYLNLIIGENYGRCYLF